MSSESQNLKWAEPLPKACPPEKTAHPPNGERYYRLTERYPPMESDFHSPRRLAPDKVFNADECHARALSLFRCPVECEKMHKLPLQAQKRFIVELVLNAESGLVERFGRSKEHYSWWVSAGFDPVGNAKPHKALIEKAGA